MSRRQDVLVRGSRGLFVVATLLASVALVSLPASPSAALEGAASPGPSVTVSPSPSANSSPGISPNPDPSPAAGPTTSPDATAAPEPSPSPAATPSPVPTPSPAPTPPVPTPPGQIGPEGGTVTDAGVSIELPAGALDAPAIFELSRVDLADPPTGTLLCAFGLAALDAATGLPVSDLNAPMTITVGDAACGRSANADGVLAVAQLMDGAWSTIGISAVGLPVGTTRHVATFAVVAQDPLADVEISQVSDAPAAGLHRIDPGSELTITLSVSAAHALDGAVLAETIPFGWAIGDADGGDYDTATATLSWPLESTGATSAARVLKLQAPSSVSPEEMPEPTSFALRLEHGGDALAAPDLEVLVAPRVLISQVTAGQIREVGGAADYLAPDAPLIDEPRYEVLRLRYEVVNADSVAVTWRPELEFAPSGSDDPATVPAGAPVAGVAFHTTPEWVRLPDGGTAPGPATAVVDAGTDHVAGLRAMGVNPLPALTLPAGARSIVEFSISATADATYQASYDFALTDAGTQLAGAAHGVVVLEAQPPILLSPGQRYGIPADDSVAPQTTLRYGLTAADYSADPIHGPSYSLTSDSCAACHRAHTALGSQLTAAPTQLALCSTCHNGIDLPDVRAAYDAVPQNDPATRSYYQHDPTVVGGALGTGNDCSDCHNPHDITSAASVAGSSGWTSSGLVAGTTGVAVTYDPITSQPIYTLVPKATLEYELCFKCHSGYAQLPSNAGQPPSHYELDAAIEFNPTNASYHPIEAPGTNDTTQMDASLAGSSPYKLWTFTSESTVRCVNCHANASLAVTGSPPLGADATLPVHASSERGVLLAPYQDRVLNGPIEPYQASDFALCFLCHSEAPFLDTSGNVRTDTNFRYHGLHVSGSALLDHGGTGTDIDTPGDGGGLATCAECHFRVHSTAFPVGDQASGSRLVDFAPDVTPLTSGDFGWTPLTDSAAGTCTLKCHGQPHTATY